MPTFTVVNMIPRSLSGESNQDSEPNLAVNPENPLQIVASAFTPNLAGAGGCPDLRFERWWKYLAAAGDCPER